MLTFTVDDIQQTIIDFGTYYRMDRLAQRGDRVKKIMKTELETPALGRRRVVWPFALLRKFLYIHSIRVKEVDFRFQLRFF